MMRCRECGSRMQKVDTTIARVEKKLRDVYVERTIWACDECGAEVEGHGRHITAVISKGTVPVDRFDPSTNRSPPVKDGVYED